MIHAVIAQSFKKLRGKWFFPFSACLSGSTMMGMLVQRFLAMENVSGSHTTPAMLVSPCKALYSTSKYHLWGWTFPESLVCMTSSEKLHKWADGGFDPKKFTNQHFHVESLNKKISWDFSVFVLWKGNQQMLFLNVGSMPNVTKLGLC